ncbi:MAG: MFS transporter [Thomasclavelia sp.]
MKKLQIKYNLIHLFFFISYCALTGYVAVFLQYKGMSNTDIGLVTGVGSLFTIVVSPIISTLPSKSKKLTMKKLINYISIITIIFYIIITLIDLPVLMIMLLYMAMISLNASIIPFLSAICMNYLKAGYSVNFGIARGLGSVAFAFSAAMLGQLIEMINPTIPAYLFVLATLGFMIVLMTLPDAKDEVKQSNQTDQSFLNIIKKYKKYFLILLGFSLPFAAACSLGTYLINIVTNLGGNTSLYGIIMFVMYVTEMPFMALTHSLLKRFKGESLLAVAALFYIMRNFTICLAPNLFVLVIGILFQGISYGLFTATIAYYVSDYLDERDQIMGQTLIAVMTTGLGSTIGNVIGGFLQDTLGLSSMLLFAMILTFIGVVIVETTLFIKKRDQKIKSETYKTNISFDKC